ncbi:class I SAM-dependent methyltransferase [Erythrobacter sp. SDW2]|uniref:class I SAM-dependent methyltransferase n=1 Tax=Erythrobacter sp. SDW2 TaxID=2907154 RepID=UPI001F1A569A|nr:class I SAM-dependent methyltransferase [Erythrobacter sp. SDW2]UIP06551.1 class I SAM-dependent methyltransferase [Erythrobacter sp. SDW2]
MTVADEKAWGDFWSQQRGQGSGGCLPEGWRGIEASQRAAWRAFVRHLPSRVRLLDLATGDGRVMCWLREELPNLHAIGIDIAPQLPPAPAGTQIRAGVSMEQLPFEDASYDAVVSQFGFEYGDIAKVANEIARVLAPDGVVGLLTHRIDGPIMVHNRERQRQIGWIFERKNLFALAHETLAARGRAFAATPMAIAQIVEEGSWRFGPQSAAWEIAEAVRRTLVMQADIRTEEIAVLLRQIEALATNELERISSLERACKTTEDTAAFDAALAAAGLQAETVEVLHDHASQRPCADFRILRLANQSS